MLELKNKHLLLKSRNYPFLTISLKLEIREFVSVLLEPK